MSYGDARMNAHAFVADHSIVVEKRFRYVHAVRDGRDDFPAFRFGFAEDLLDGWKNRVTAIFEEQFIEAPECQTAGGDLRAHVAERGFGKTNIVANNLKQQLVDFSRFIDLELIELQTFHPGIKN